MFFKNLMVWHFPDPIPFDAAALEVALHPRRFRPCGAQEMAACGWVPPIGKDDDAPLVHAASGCLLFCLQDERRLLPTAVVIEAVAERAEALEADQGRPVTRKERDGIKDEVLTDLIPKAFVTHRRVYAYIDLRGRWLVVDAASTALGDGLVGVLRQCLGSLPVLVLANVRNRPDIVMTRWLGGEELPANLALETSCRLKGCGEDDGEVVLRRTDLCGDELKAHLDAGKEVQELALSYRERMAFTLTSTLRVKRLRFLDLAREEAAGTETETLEERMDADFAIMAGELAELLPALAGMFGGWAGKV